ncbi:MAG: amino acid adenylation domain-containing protein, partial [Gemmatimonadetes bacterium]|nr:amino acid adenylation domain-containing protein [Gemmatimonadota bacterium]
ATRVGARARAAFGVKLAPRDLFEADTVAKLAARIEALRAPEPAAEPAAVAETSDEPEPGIEPEGPSFIAPRTATEEQLAALFGEVLKVERVDVHDSFFALGGHSLKATRLGARVRQALGVKLAPRDLFEADTVAKLALRIETIRRAELGMLPPVAPVERTEAMRLSFAQERLWFLDRLQPGSTAYNRPLALRLRGPLSVRGMERALAELVRRHESLRTVFAEHDGVPVQRVMPAGPFAVPVADLTRLATPAREVEAMRRVDEEAKRPFDLATGPLFRASMLKLGAEDHVLLVSLHHIVSDGWSLGVIFSELEQLYGAFREGRPSPLKELVVQYADYAAWQRRHLAGEEMDAQLAWWREQLEGAPALLELPTDHPRPAQPAHAGASELARFSGELLGRLNALARGENASLYMVLLGAFQVLLARYAGTDDVVVGSPIAGRTTDELEGLIGFFVNTLALRTRLDGDPSFRDVVARVRDTTLAAYERQDLPFEKLVEALHPERTLSHAPVFQVMFTMANAMDGGDLELAGLKVEDLAQDTGAAKFDLTLHFGEVGGELWANLGYSTELFERDTALRMLGHLERLLDAVTRDPAAPVSALEMMGHEERAEAVEGWNATDADLPAVSVHALLEAQAARTPDAVAVRAGSGALTYAELNVRANRLAHHLVKLGVGPDVLVGLCVERGLEMAVAVLAVLKAGGAYVPLDPDYPADRLRDVVMDSAPAVILAHAVPAELVAGIVGDARIPVVDLAADRAKWARLPKGNPARGVTPEHLCYVIYTSGSTGKPKGVMNQHSTVVNRVTWGARAWEMTADDAVLCKTSLGFDGHVRELFLPWSIGARVVMARPDGQRDPRYLLDAIRGEGITTVNLVPTMLQVLLDEPGVEEACAGLSRILCGGEALSGALLERALDRLPGTALHNLYGPSEAATAAAMLHCGAAQLRATAPIGRPQANTRIYLVDAAGNPVPVGVPGEILIGGAGVARGYLARPGQTAERFVPDAFSGEPGARLYRTGDLARRLADGTIEFLGRNDFQVKVRGYRIEPGEVEARLLEHPSVREAVVLARPDANGENRLVAWVAADDADPQALRAHLSARLPDYMVPAAFVRVDALPLTPSGKLDRRALPEPAAEALATRPWEAPQGDAETAIAAVWAEVLGIDRVGRWDHFFELGGHSLRAVQVVSRVRTALGIEAALSDVFLRPVLADFAAGLAEAARSQLPPVEPVGRELPLPLSFAQQRLWFLERMGSGGAVYNVPLRLRLRGDLDRHALERALARIVERHEALRTVFGEAEGEPVQRVLSVEESRFTLADHDLSGRADARAALERMMTEDARAPFDLETGPVIRGALVRMAADDHVLFVTLHHIASDAWSVGVLVEELRALYAAFTAGEADPLPPLPVQYGDFAAWQRRWLEGPVLQAEADYWTRTLAGAPEVIELPLDRPRPAQQEYAGGRAHLALDAELTEGLKALSRRHG